MSQPVQQLVRSGLLIIYGTRLVDVTVNYLAIFNIHVEKHKEKAGKHQVSFSEFFSLLDF